MDDGGYERVAGIPDLHAPHVDERAFACTLAFLGVFKPHYLYVLGDVVDFYQLSRFDKDPGRLASLQSDIDDGYRALKRIRATVPRETKCTVLEGNHENRVVRCLRANLPGMESLRNLRIPELLNLGELEMAYEPTGITTHRGCIIKHGNIVSPKSGYTAYRELDKAGISGISGHTHRLGQVYRTNYGGMTTWVEAGCLCRTDNVEYIHGVADWQHGLAYGYWRKGDRRFVVHTLPIINGRAVFNGREIGARR